MNSFDQLLHTHVVASLDKQLRLPRLLGGQAAGRLDLRRGVMHFTGGHLFSAQLLGFESSRSNTWKWAWADETMRMPPDLLEVAHKLRAAGKKHYIMEFSEARYGLDICGGRQLALLASGICKADCFFKVRREHQSLYMLLMVPPLRALGDPSPAHVRRVFKQAITNFELNHRTALKNYLLFKGYTYEQHDTTIDATLPDGQWLRAHFGEDDCLTHMELSCGSAEVATAGEPIYEAILLEESLPKAEPVADDPLSQLASSVEQSASQHRYRPGNA